MGMVSWASGGGKRRRYAPCQGFQQFRRQRGTAPPPSQVVISHKDGSSRVISGISAIASSDIRANNRASVNA